MDDKTKREIESPCDIGYYWGRLAWLVVRVIAILLLGATSSTFVYQAF